MGSWLQSALEGLWMLLTYLDDHGPGCFVQVGQNGRQGSLASANGRFPTPFVCSGPIQGTCVHPPIAVAAQDSQVESAIQSW